MSNQGWNTMQTMPKLEKVELKNSIPLIIPDNILDKIEYLCKSIAKVEWSGILFYQVEGTIKDSSKVRIICKDILLMDKGSQAYTEYDWDEDVVEYRMNNPESMDWLVGHIHSHNTMNVFFSGTDMSELNDNCPNHNIYLSLIVNNYLEMTAKIAFTAQPQVFTCKDEEGKDYTLRLEQFSSPSYMFIYDCNIERNIKTVSVDEEFANRVKLVENKSEKKKQEQFKIQQQQASQSKIITSGNPNEKKDWGNFSNNKSPFPDFEPKTSSNKNFYDANKAILEEMEETDEVLTIEEQFTAFILRLGNHVENDDAINALEDIGIANLSAESMASSILESYPAYYENFFDKEEGYNTDEKFLDVLESVIDILEMELEEFDFLAPIIAGLKTLGNKFEETLKV